MTDAAEAHETPPADPEYAYKPSVMGSACAFRVAPDEFHWEVGRHGGEVPYTDIRAIRLSFRPITLANYRFIAEIWVKGLPKLTVASTSWRSMVEQQRRDADYTTFLRKLHERIRANGAKPDLLVGLSPYLYWPGIVAMIGMFVAMVVLIWRTVSAGVGGAAAFGFVFMALLAWQLGTFFYRNRPGHYRADALPPQVLPRDS